MGKTGGLFILTGEPSGDAYAAEIVAQLQRGGEKGPIAGIGCQALAAAGVPLVVRMDDYAVMGVLPVLRRLPDFLALGRQVEAAIRAQQPRVILGVDYPGFNFRMYQRLADLRAAGTRIIHLVAPQVWAWRRRRAKRLARAVDRMLCFFPFEPDYFTRFGCQAEFVGHPLVDLISQRVPRANSRTVLLAPGGRRKEVASLLPIQVQAARLLQRWLPAESLQVVVSKVPAVPASCYAGCPFELSERPYRQLCTEARIAAIASGTACLEAALIGLPHVLCYRLDQISGRIAPHLIQVPYVGLPNLVHHLQVCPELVQVRLNPQRLAAALYRGWQPQRNQAWRETLMCTDHLLGGGGAMARIAAILVRELAGDGS